MSSTVISKYCTASEIIVTRISFIQCVAVVTTPLTYFEMAVGLVLRGSLVCLEPDNLNFKFIDWLRCELWCLDAHPAYAAALRVILKKNYGRAGHERFGTDDVINKLTAVVASFWQENKRHRLDNKSPAVLSKENFATFSLNWPWTVSISSLTHFPASTLGPTPFQCTRHCDKNDDGHDDGDCKISNFFPLYTQRDVLLIKCSNLYTFNAITNFPLKTSSVHHLSRNLVLLCVKGRHVLDKRKHFTIQFIRPKQCWLFT